MNELIQTLGLGLGASWLSGINLYATVATFGLLERFKLVDLPGSLDVLANPYVIGVAAFLYVIEFVADKIPYVDTVWDAVHTFIRVPAGAVIALAATTSMNPAAQMIALLIGGTLALSTHGTKATMRAAANTSPEPVSNWTLSILEDVFVIGAAILATLNPMIIVVAMLIFLIVLAWIIPKVIRRLRRMINSTRAFLSGQSLREAATNAKPI